MSAKLRETRKACFSHKKGVIGQNVLMKTAFKP